MYNWSEAVKFKYIFAILIIMQKCLSLNNVMCTAEGPIRTTKKKLIQYCFS